MAIEFKVTLEDRPGLLARLGGVLGDARVNIEAIQGMSRDGRSLMSKAGINIDSVYVTAHGHIVLGVDDLVGAIQVAGGMAVMTLE